MSNTIQRNLKSDTDFKNYLYCCSDESVCENSMEIEDGGKILDSSKNFRSSVKEKSGRLNSAKGWPKRIPAPNPDNPPEPVYYEVQPLEYSCNKQSRDSRKRV